jgi:glycosyltransferase involved in cell wall biosynthesis
MERTRLCIVTDAWLPQVNGVVTTLTNLVEQAEKDNWEVLVIHPGLFKNIPAPGYSEVRLSWPYGLKQKIKDFKPHHLHIATEGPLGLRARISFRNNTFTTAYHTNWPLFLKNILKIPPVITWKFVKWFHANSKVMVPTQGIKEELESYNVGESVVLFSRGVNLDNLRPRITHIPSDRKTKLICVSRVSKEKNLDVFCNLNQKKYQLTLVGDGPYLEELRQQYKWVKFTGMLKGSDLADEYINSECFVFPSLTDTFGIVMIESMCLGTPVAAFPVNGPKDVIIPGTGVMDTDIDSAIEKALMLNRGKCMNAARAKYNWTSAWNQFKFNLIDHSDDTNFFFLNI